MSEESDDYELFVKKIIQALTGAKVSVRRLKEYKGIRSKRKIKVDVSFTQRIVGGAKILVLVECKCYSHTVTVDDVEEFCTKITDIGAHKGIMVTTVGYQDGCKKTAKGFGIALALITKEEQPGELVYVVNTSEKLKKPDNQEFWAGNLWGPFDGADGGLRFDSLSQMLSWMYLVKQTEHPTEPSPETEDDDVSSASPS